MTMLGVLPDSCAWTFAALLLLLLLADVQLPSMTQERSYPPDQIARNIVTWTAAAVSSIEPIDKWACEQGTKDSRWARRE